MVQLFELLLENPMDLVLANKRSIRAGELLKLSISFQTAFTTAISETARVIFDHNYHGTLSLNILNKESEYCLVALLSFKDDEQKLTLQSFDYAKKLVRNFSLQQTGEVTIIELVVPIPRSLKISDRKIQDLSIYFDREMPYSFYEQVKNQNVQLNKTAEQQEAALKESKYLNEKKNEFLSVASHELKTPLAILKGFTQIALDVCGDNDLLEPYLRKINQQTTKLSNLVTQLLDISKIEAGQLDFTWQEMPANKYMQDEVESIKTILPQHSVVINLGQDVVLKLDTLRMEQVLSNLLSNAAKYSSPKTTIVFSSEIMEANYIRFSVKDQGIGMSAASSKRVFEKFYRAEAVTKKYSGLGMGLYITSKIIIEHGGKIWLESEEGAGTVVHFTLPYVSALEHH